MRLTRALVALVVVLAACGGSAGSASHAAGSASPESSAPRPSTDARGALSNVEGRNPAYVPSANHDTSVVVGNYPSQQQVDVVAYAPTSAVAFGQRFALTIEATPRAKMHVYAPGANGYKTVSLTVNPEPYIHAQRIVYPKSEIYEFKPLNERVPAYQKPFTLVQQMTLDGSAAARAALKDQKSLTITGRFDYQACDDGTCYNPSSVPLTWTINLK